MSPSNALSHPKYRPDIDGLRAVAVLAVVVFHAFPRWLKGGFIGVDVFFVISGFLISTIIFENLEAGRFSFLEFYSRRVKRIFPALLLILLTCLVLGWFLLLASEYRQLGRDMAAGAGFVSNIVLWSESGYFDTAADVKPLIHLWSLGIEEQFYIFWPLLLWLAWKWRSNLLVITVLFAAFSLALNVLTVGRDATAAFYSPQTRFWELLIGSTLAYVSLHVWPVTPVTATSHSHARSLLGVLLLLAGFALVTRERDFPGWSAALPTVGAALIISAGPKAWFNRRVLAHPLMVWVGLISFPLYLWHWPLLTFARINAGEVPSVPVRLVAVFLAVALAWLTYRLVERPIRVDKTLKVSALALLIMMGVVGGGGYLCFAMEGFPGLGYRSPDKTAFSTYFENDAPAKNYFKRIDWRRNYRIECDFYDTEKEFNGEPWDLKMPRSSIDPSCYTRDPARPKALFIWGDSHAQQLYFGLRENLPRDWQILQVATSGCRPELVPAEGQVELPRCTHANAFALQAIRVARPDVVLVVLVAV